MKSVVMKKVFYVVFIAAICSTNTKAQENFIAANNKTFASKDANVSSPVHPQYSLLQKELSVLEQIKNKGGWGKISITAKKIYRQGDRNATIRQIKQRLYISGYIDQPDTSSLYTKELVPAVKKLQKQYGFKEDGQVFTEFVKELNIPVENRIRQVQLNMQRIEKMPAPVQGTRLVANIPEYKLHVYEGEQLMFDIPIVVGKESTATVTFNDEMKHIVFAPYWNVPESIVQNEILPAVRRDRTYLKRNGYEQVGTENGLPKFRQKPGGNNSLGLVKFVFPNSHNIYFHDTPAKSLFNVRKRAFSHGCIRLAEPQKLAAYLLKNKSGWDENAISKAMNAGKEQWVALEQPVPVSIVYITAWVDETGLLNFREDIYGHDK
jgi:murein L,D-transpeptidase YcbB/YkuD